VDPLLAMVGPSLFIFQRRELGMSLEQLKAGVGQVLDHSTERFAPLRLVGGLSRLTQAVAGAPDRPGEGTPGR